MAQRPAQTDQHQPRTWTIQDVAKLANVSIKPVSRVINNEPAVKQETRDRVTRVIGELGYSPHSGARYPVKWRLRIPSVQLELSLAANLDDQEMHTPRSTGVVYWEGSVHATGTRGDAPIDGVGYVELTGYASPFNAPL